MGIIGIKSHLGDSIWILLCLFIKFYPDYTEKQEVKTGKCNNAMFGRFHSRNKISLRSSLFYLMFQLLDLIDGLKKNK
jgi:hypothetical protein